MHILLLSTDWKLSFQYTFTDGIAIEYATRYSILTTRDIQIHTTAAKKYSLEEI